MSVDRAQWSAGLPTPIGDVLSEATGRSHRRDAVRPRTGGPAGNAQLTAWLGLVLLALVVVEIVTTLDVSGLLSWHVAVGALLVPYALSKTGSTSWRIARYYAGHQQYAQAGPPPLLLRVLGPLVIVATLGLLATGVTLILVGPTSGRRPFVTVLGQGVDDLSLHQLMFIVFCVVTGLHVLARIVPAIALATGHLQRRAGHARPLPGRWLRLAVVTTALALGVVTAVLLVRDESAWTRDREHVGPPRAAAPLAGVAGPHRVGEAGTVRGRLVRLVD